MTELTPEQEWLIFQDRVQSLLERWHRYVRRTQDIETAIKGFLFEAKECDISALIRTLCIAEYNFEEFKWRNPNSK